MAVGHRPLAFRTEAGLISLALPPAAAIRGELRPGSKLEVLGRLRGGRLRAAEVWELEPGGGWLAVVASWRAHARRLIVKAVPGRPQGVLLAALLGERGRMPPRLREAFASTGSAHLLSISGLHASLLLGGLLAALTLLRLTPGEQRVVGALAVLLLVLVVGARAPILRAGTAAAIFLLLPGRGDGWNRLSVGLLVVLAWDPLAPRSVGFQLSFGTVAGILALGPPLVRWAGGRRRPLRAALAGSVACFLSSAPLLALTFDSLPLAALPLSLPSTSLFAMILGLSAAGVVVGTLLPPLGELLLIAAGQLAEVLFALVEGAAAVPGASVPLQPGPTPLAVVALGTIALGMSRRERGQAGAGLMAVGGALLLLVLLGGARR